MLTNYLKIIDVIMMAFWEYIMSFTDITSARIIQGASTMQIFFNPILF